MGLGILAFVVRPVLNTVLAPALPAPSARGSIAGPQDGPREAPRELAGPGAQAASDGNRQDRRNLPDLREMPDLSDLSSLPEPGSIGAEDPVERLRRLIADRREETIEVLRGWMDEAPEEAR